MTEEKLCVYKCNVWWIAVIFEYIKRGMISFKAHIYLSSAKIASDIYEPPMQDVTIACNTDY